MLIDPDLHGIFTKRKATVSNLLNDTIPAVGVKYLNDDRWKSLERMLLSWELNWTSMWQILENERQILNTINSDQFKESENLSAWWIFKEIEANSVQR